MAKDNLIRFLPSYVGSKRAWVNHLSFLQGRPFVELFAGSGVLSANLASKAILVDLDPVVHRILSRFPEQIVPEEFTREDYYHYRFADNWWQYAYCLQAMSYSGVFRYSKRGYNVPAKGGENPEQNKVNTFYNRASYEKALERWRDLAPDVRLCSYADITDEEIAALGDDVVVILDPPYEGSQAAYNASVGVGDDIVDNNSFDYDAYWKRAAELVEQFNVILFDRQENLERQGYRVDAIRKMRVNGARPGDAEAMSLQFKNIDRGEELNLWEGTDLLDAVEPVVID